jgi:hypothetical protein
MHGNPEGDIFLLDDGNHPHPPSTERTAVRIDRLAPDDLARSPFADPLVLQET